MKKWLRGLCMAPNQIISLLAYSTKFLYLLQIRESSHLMCVGAASFFNGNGDLILQPTFILVP